MKNNRRNFLKGLGVAMALPAFDCFADTKKKKPVNTAYFFVPNGVEYEFWEPEKTGRSYKLTPLLEPLEDFKPP